MAGGQTLGKRSRTYSTVDVHAHGKRTTAGYTGNEARMHGRYMHNGMGSGARDTRHKSQLQSRDLTWFGQPSTCRFQRESFCREIARQSAGRLGRCVVVSVALLRHVLCFGHGAGRMLLCGLIWRRHLIALHCAHDPLCYYSCVSYSGLTGSSCFNHAAD